MPILRATCEYKRTAQSSIKCNVFCAEQKNGPVVVYLHGGALIAFDRTSLQQYEKNALVKAGISVVSIDYRLAPETKLKEIIEDVRDALDWVRGEGAKIFGWDPERLGVFGGSAGGYLTLMTGTFERKPKALVSMYGYGDILGDWYGKPDPFYCQSPKVSQEDAYKNIRKHERTGNDVANIYLYTRQTGTWVYHVSGWDPNIASEREKVMPYCPAFNVTADYPPTILMHGTKDTDVPYEQSVIMLKALQEKGIESRLITMEGMPHGFDCQKPRTPELCAALNEALEFFKEKL